MKKEYLKDENGKIRMCDKNIAQMNILYLIYRKHFGLDYISWKQALQVIGGALLLIICIIAFPIIVFIMAYADRECSRKEVKRCK